MNVTSAENVRKWPLTRKSKKIEQHGRGLGQVVMEKRAV